MVWLVTRQLTAIVCESKKVTSMLDMAVKERLHLLQVVVAALLQTAGLRCDT